jgi:nucleotide sugar dehydrogenase
MEDGLEEQEMVDAFLKSLQDRSRSVGIWGSGAIGSSAAYYFARVGLRCVAYDVSEERIREIRAGQFQSTSAQAFSTGDKDEDLGVTATTRWRDLEKENVGIHLVSVPTERAAEPSAAALEDVMPQIAQVIKKTPQRPTPPVVSIESTILPHWVDSIVVPALQEEGLTPGQDILVGAAPRRDWFNGADFTIETLPRIVGGWDDRSTAVLCAFYSLVCRIVQPAMDAQHAAFTKVIENVMRYQGITFANSLALAFPQFDMRHILRLASTKWNIPYYFPSLGVGGHCIPLAPQYVLEEGGRDNAYLGEIRNALDFNDSYFESLYDRRMRGMLEGKRSVGILGLAYTANAKMHKLSPAFSVLDLLRATPRLRLHDPYYTGDEIYDLCSVPAMQFPDDIPDCDALVLVTPHNQYVQAPIEEYVAPGTAVVDNTGVWSNRVFADGVEYYEVGRIPGRRGSKHEPYSSTAD